MAEALYCTFYLVIFSFIILKSNLFSLPGLKNGYALGAFALKLLFGIVLWYIYAYHYKNRYSSDIFKYFDDGKMLYQTIHSNFSDFLKMLTGIGDSTPHIQGYYHEMKSWINDHDSSLYNNSHFIIRLTALFMFLSGGHYAVHVIFMCFISLIGFSFLYKSFYPYLQGSPKGLFAAVFLFPSVLLWGSGILKEGLIFFSIGILIYYYQKLLAKDEYILRNLLLFLAGVLLTFELKAYVLLCLLPGFISEYLIRKVKTAGHHPWVTYLLITASYLLLGLNINLIYPTLEPIQMLSDKQTEFINLSRGGIHLVLVSDTTKYAYLPIGDSDKVVPANAYADSLLRHAGTQYLTSPAFIYHEEITHKIAPFRIKAGTKYGLIGPSNDTTRSIATDSSIYYMDIYNLPAKSLIKITPFKPTLTGLISFVPQAFIISLIRPYPNEIHSATVLIYFFENVILLLLIVLALLFRRKKTEHNNIIAFCLNYCLLMLVLIGLSTPLYGGIERYKSVVIPFMLILLLLIYDKEKIQRILRITK